MAEEKPVLIEVAPSTQTDGAAFTLQYKNRFLYSKYNPQKNILQAVQGLTLLPDTLVLVFSPALFYGWNELREKCKAAASEILCVEADAALHDFAKKTIQEKELDAALLPLEQNTPRGLDEHLSSRAKKFRRVLRLDFSAGVSFNADFYKGFFECAQNIVAAFWKNRLTLVQLGRLYCKNILKNLIPAAAALPFEALERTIEKPILVCGAGESLDELTRAARANGPERAQRGAGDINKSFFVLAVDAALPALAAAGIKIDAVAATESQLAIEKAYIGLKGALAKTESKPLFFFDLSSRAQIARRFFWKNGANGQDRGAAVCFYFSEFDKNGFIERLSQNGLLPAAAPPLGSVGLAAARIALRLRKSAAVPVCVLGLDFSYSAGRTHARGTAQSGALLAQSNRLRPAQNCAAAFASSAEKILGKDGRGYWTSKNMFGYAALFRQYFNGAQNLFDLGKSGIDLGLERKSLADFIGKETLAATGEPLSLKEGQAFGREKKAMEFLTGELSALKALADLLSNGEGSNFRDKSLSLDEQILQGLGGREYLYLHFPDGTAPSLERSFLTRVRAQIDFFAKDIETALAVE